MRRTLQDMGHTNPPTPTNYNNTALVGIANETVKKPWSQPMEMRYFYSCNQVKEGKFDVRWHPGLENLGDYTTKIPTTKIMSVRSTYTRRIHQQNCRRQ